MTDEELEAIEDRLSHAQAPVGHTELCGCMACALPKIGATLAAEVHSLREQLEALDGHGPRCAVDYWS